MNTKIIRLLCILIGTFALTSAKAQEDKKLDLKDKLYFGGNFGANFYRVNNVNGSFNVFNLELSPRVGYRITPAFSAGPGITYQYINIDKKGFSNYGWALFARYDVFSNLFLYSEFEQLNYQPPRFNFQGELVDRILVESMFVGGGYSSAISRNAAFNIMVLFNLNDSAFSPYSNPIIRIGVTAGL